MDLSSFSANLSDNSISAVYNEIMVNTYLYDTIWTYFSNFGHHPWIFSIVGSVLIGLSGIFPLLIIPIDEGENLKSGTGSKTLRLLLSFAVGGLLGDVFLHLLPEAWQRSDIRSSREAHPSMSTGLCVLAGLLVFVVLEKLITTLQTKQEQIATRQQQKQQQHNNNVLYKEHKQGNGYHVANGGAVGGGNGKHVAGYLNLLANSIDNFTHGLAVGSSFCISFRLGALSTFAILIHEIPHEVGDFAILLRSGFTRWEAAKAQICTATAGILGSWFAVAYGTTQDNDVSTSWILPFTAGGFLHIALVTVLPELIHEESPWESVKQFVALLAGITIMALLTLVFD